MTPVPDRKFTRKEYYWQISNMNIDAKSKQNIHKTNVITYLKGQIRFSPGMQNWFIIGKLMYLIHHLKILKEKTT